MDNQKTNLMYKNLDISSPTYNTNEFAKSPNNTTYDIVSKQCPFCKKDFISSASHLIYCSDECQKNMRRASQRKKQHQKYIDGLACRHCHGKSMSGNRYAVKCCLNKECIEKEEKRRKDILSKTGTTDRKRNKEVDKIYQNKNRKKSI